MNKIYETQESKIISEYMMVEEHVKTFCEKLISYKLTFEKYNIPELKKEEIHYSLLKNLNGDIIRTSISKVDDGEETNICIFANGKIFINIFKIKINDIHTIVLSEIRNQKLNDIGI
jgi:hypothetical protein